MWSDKYIIGQGHNPPLFHKIDTWNFAPNDVNDYFEIKRPTNVVIAPGSDMPYCAVHYVEGVPTNGDGWAAQAANPAAYVSLMDANQDTDEITWHPILLSHIPTTLMPGYYVPALPMGAYVGDFWDHEHAWAAGLDDCTLSTSQIQRLPTVDSDRSVYVVEFGAVLFHVVEFPGAALVGRVEAGGGAALGGEVLH